MADNNQEDLQIYDQHNDSNASSSTPLVLDDNLEYRNFYKDILYFTEENQVSSNVLFSENKLIETEDDPMNDPQFMAFLACLPYETATDVPQENPKDRADNSKVFAKKRDTKSSPRRSSSTKFGYCEHPKHNYYRQEKYLWASSTLDQALVMKAIPRRGRPPKGSKSSEHLLSSLPHSTDELVQFPSVELTVRSLPKRLESVVGKSNIKVCLTCLKRSDTDPDYLKNEFYVGPQHPFNKYKKEK
ncbi:hypothetical protein BD560DRAFT_460156 [Blakeslea trispora]|nr:hypothetical protein BD560DRAFT_460156 [Blakeslea trispora]